MTELDLQINEIVREISRRIDTEGDTILIDMLRNEEWDEELLDELNDWLLRLVGL